MLSIQYILGRYPARKAFGWYPLIQVGSELWDIKMYVVRLQYGLTYISIYQTRIGSREALGTGDYSLVVSRFLYHQAHNVAIGTPNIVGSWLDGWYKVVNWSFLKVIIREAFPSDPDIIRPSRLTSIIFSHNAPLDLDPAPEVFKAWHAKIQNALTLHVWRYRVDTARATRIQRYWRRNRLAIVAARREQGYAPTIRILLEMHAAGRIDRNRLAELMKIYITTCVLNPDKEVAAERLKLIETLSKMNDIEKRVASNLIKQNSDRRQINRKSYNALPQANPVKAY